MHMYELKTMQANQKNHWYDAEKPRKPLPQNRSDGQSSIRMAPWFRLSEYLF